MSRIKRFWADVKERTSCRRCGSEDFAWFQRSHYEQRGNFRCAECGAEGVYICTSTGSADVTLGYIETDGIDHQTHETDECEVRGL